MATETSTSLRQARTKCKIVNLLCLIVIDGSSFGEFVFSDKSSKSQKSIFRNINNNIFNLPVSGKKKMQLAFKSLRENNWKHLQELFSGFTVRSMKLLKGRGL